MVRVDPSSHPACRRVRGVSGVSASVGIGRESEVGVGSPSGLVVSGMSKVAGACILVQCVVWTGCRRPGAGPGCRCGLVCAGKIRRSVENKKKSKKNPDSRVLTRTRGKRTLQSPKVPITPTQFRPERPELGAWMAGPATLEAPRKTPLTPRRCRHV